MSYLELNNVWKQYDQQVVLEGVNARVEKGEFITIVGASGCGKTTFLKMLLGTETQTRGTILLNGKPIASEPDAQRGIVFQRYSVFPHLTVLGNVVLPIELPSRPVLSRLFGTSRRHAEAEAMAMLELVGLAQAAHRYPHELSGGMQQRLAIAQSLMRKPAILLLDEPFGALDPGIRADMHQLVLRLWREHQLTVFMITHDLKEGFYLGTRLWVFDKWRQDPQAPDAYGAGITYDIPVGRMDEPLYESIAAEQAAKTAHEPVVAA